MQPESNNWYSNKDLHEKIITVEKSLIQEFTELRSELKTTREEIKKYNNLRSELNKVINKVSFFDKDTCANTKKQIKNINEAIARINNTNLGAKEFGGAIRSWSAWFIGIGVFILSLLTFLNTVGLIK